ncbi:MAG: 30S ribosomal protein S14, partial [Waterburya sp.]
MAKKGMIEREKKRAQLVAKYADKRAELKERFRKATSAAEKLDIHRQIQRLPRDSSATR